MVYNIYNINGHAFIFKMRHKQSFCSTHNDKTIMLSSYCRKYREEFLITGTGKTHIGFLLTGARQTEYTSAWPKGVFLNKQLPQ